MVYLVLIGTSSSHIHFYVTFPLRSSYILPPPLPFYSHNKLVRQPRLRWLDKLRSPNWATQFIRNLNLVPLIVSGFNSFFTAEQSKMMFSPKSPTSYCPQKFYNVFIMIFPWTRIYREQDAKQVSANPEELLELYTHTCTHTQRKMRHTASLGCAFAQWITRDVAGNWIRWCQFCREEMLLRKALKQEVCKRGPAVSHSAPCLPWGNMASLQQMAIRHVKCNSLLFSPAMRNSVSKVSCECFQP